SAGVRTEWRRPSRGPRSGRELAHGSRAAWSRNDGGERVGDGVGRSVMLNRQQARTALGGEEMELRGVDRNLQGPADLRLDPRVEAGAEEGLISREEAFLFGLASRFGRHPRRFDREEDVQI